MAFAYDQSSDIRHPRLLAINKDQLMSFISDSFCLGFFLYFGIRYDIKWKYFVSSIFETKDCPYRTFQAQLKIYTAVTKTDSQILKIYYRNIE